MYRTTHTYHTHLTMTSTNANAYPRIDLIFVRHESSTFKTFFPVGRVPDVCVQVCFIRIGIVQSRLVVEHPSTSCTQPFVIAPVKWYKVELIVL